MEQQKQVDLGELADLCTPWCIRVAATLRIADHMAAGKEQVAELAAAANCDAGVLERVLGHLVTKGVFEMVTPGRFALNDTSRQLLDPITRVTLDIEDLGGRMAYVWGTLLAFTRTGEPAYDTVFGLPFFEDLKAHPQIAASFDALIGPAGHGTPSPDFDLTGGWESIRTVMDVGGGTGAMLAEILRARPHIRGILLDQPETVARSGAVFQAAGVAERVQTVGQSFFDPLPPGADLYLLRGILNDWPDREAVAILQRCAEAAQPAGRVVVLKGGIPDDAPKDLTIEMVLVGGKQRTAAEFRDLAQKVGLAVLFAGQQPGGYFVVECRPV